MALSRLDRLSASPPLAANCFCRTETCTKRHSAGYGNRFSLVAAANYAKQRLSIAPLHTKPDPCMIKTAGPCWSGGHPAKTVSYVMTTRSHLSPHLSMQVLAALFPACQNSMHLFTGCRHLCLLFLSIAAGISQLQEQQNRHAGGWAYPQINSVGSDILTCLHADWGVKQVLIEYMCLDRLHLWSCLYKSFVKIAVGQNPAQVK